MTKSEQIIQENMPYVQKIIQENMPYVQKT